MFCILEIFFISLFFGIGNEVNAVCSRGASAYQPLFSCVTIIANLDSHQIIQTHDQITDYRSRQASCQDPKETDK